MAVAPEKKCSNPECTVATTGRCVEGFAELTDCPHYGREIPATVETTDDASKLASDAELELPSGEPLSVAAATDILRAHANRVIAVIGPMESGKTTLVASLYDVFQNGLFGGFSFMSSETLPAFEQRCHLARAASNRTTPNTERTSRSHGLKFYHLGLSLDHVRRVDLLLSDRSGEDFRVAADSQEFCTGLIEVSRADLVLLLVDGKKLSDATVRHSVSADTKLMLQAVLDAGLLTVHHRVALVLTKSDLIEVCEDKARVHADFERLVRWVREQFVGRVAEILDFEVAARPETVALKAGYGLDKLFKACVAEPRIPQARKLPTRKLDRAYHALGIL